MTSEIDDLGKALQENLKLRRDLATGLAEAKGEKLAAVRYRLARIVGAIRYAFTGRNSLMSLAEFRLGRELGPRCGKSFWSWERTSPALSSVGERAVLSRKLLIFSDRAKR